MKFLDEEDEPTAIVPLKTIQKKETLDYGGSCKVTWSNHKSYRAFLLFSGTKDECAKKQDEVDPEESEEEDALPVKRTRNVCMHIRTYVCKLYSCMTGFAKNDIITQELKSNL